MTETLAMVRNILLVEDDEITNFISINVLKEMGIEKINAAENGRLACCSLTEACPDLIFLDISMPVMDGFEFLAEKEKRGLCPDVRIAMLTSSARPADKEKAFSFPNVVDYVEKPLDTQKVERLMAKLLDQK